MTAESAAAAGAAEQSRNCCSDFYEQDWVRTIASDNFHPGGEALSRRLAGSMGLEPGDRVVDLGCGTGTTALLLSGDPGLEVTGIDASEINIERARERVPGAEFLVADAAAIPLPDACCDAVIAECAFSLFADKEAALAEARRILHGGGCLGITDMAVEGRLPQDVAEIAAPWTCLADAMGKEAYESTFEQAGFSVVNFEDESGGILELVSRLKRSLLLLAAGEASGTLPAGLPLQQIRHWLDRIRAEVEAGVVRYYRFELQLQPSLRAGPARPR